MKLKDSQEALFHHYILDPNRKKRECKYLVGMLIALAVYVAWVVSVFADPPRGQIGAIPSIIFVIVITQALYYFIYSWYVGAKVVDLDKDLAEGLHGPKPEQ